VQRQKSEFGVSQGTRIYGSEYQREQKMSPRNRHRVSEFSNEHRIREIFNQEKQETTPRERTCKSM
jgi:hypothetical protein